MKSRPPYLCPQTIKRRPCWCPDPIRELNSIIMQTFSLFSLKNMAVDHVSETQEFLIRFLWVGLERSWN